MKKLIACCLVLLLHTGAIKPNSISLTVKISQLTDNYEKWRSVFGSYVSVDTLNVRILTARMRYVAQGRDVPVRVEFAMVGKDAQAGLVLYHYHKRDGYVHENGVVSECSTISPVILQNNIIPRTTDAGLTLKPEDRVTGLIPFGWSVRVLDKDGTVVASEASTYEMKNQIQEIIRKMDAKKLADLNKSAEERLAK